MKPSTSLLLILLPALAMAAPPAGDATQAPKQDLKDVRQQINALEKEVKAKEANRAEATDALRASEVAISEANRALASRRWASSSRLILSIRALMRCSSACSLPNCWRCC